jgi:hypothetical protein
MLEVLSKSSLISIVATLLSISFFMIYFAVKKPSYVKEKNEKGEYEFSIRIALVYSMLFSSLIGLIVITISGMGLYSLFVSQNKNIEVEKPTLKMR